MPAKEGLVLGLILVLVGFALVCLYITCGRLSGRF
jgi:hypothetical protein